MAGSLFTYMTWCKSSATWLQQDVDRTTERDEQLLGLIAPGAKCRPMEKFGVVQSRLLKVPLRRRHLIPCVLHLLIFVGSLGMFSGDLLEGSNRVLKDIWSSFCDRGGGAGSLVSRRIKMLRQVNERLFLYFEVPRWNGTSRSNLCNAKKLADDVRAYFADEELW